MMCNLCRITGKLGRAWSSRGFVSVTYVWYRCYQWLLLRAFDYLISILGLVVSQRAHWVPCTTNVVTQ